MTRGVTTLETMLQDLRYETRRSPNINIGQDEEGALKRVLVRTQNFLYWDFDWPFLRQRADLTLQQDQRYYDVPSTINFERILRARGNGNDYWKPVIRGITMEQYNTFDSDDGDTSYPVERYDILHTGTNEQIEVWPMPDQDDETLRFDSIRNLDTFVSDTDTCTLDDTLVVLFAAAHVLNGQDDKLGQAVLNQANQMYRRMRGGAQRREGNSFVMGSEVSVYDPHDNPQVIAVKDSS